MIKIITKLIQMLTFCPLGLQSSLFHSPPIYHHNNIVRSVRLRVCDCLRLLSKLPQLIGIQTSAFQNLVLDQQFGKHSASNKRKYLKCKMHCPLLSPSPSETFIVERRGCSYFTISEPVCILDKVDKDYIVEEVAHSVSESVLIRLRKEIN